MTIEEAIIEESRNRDRRNKALLERIVNTERRRERDSEQLTEDIRVH
jgi:hypothetical protein